MEVSNFCCCLIAWLCKLDGRYVHKKTLFRGRTKRCCELRDKKVPLKAKRKRHKTLARPEMTCGTEWWASNKRDAKKTEALEMIYNIEMVAWTCIISSSQQTSIFRAKRLLYGIRSSSESFRNKSCSATTAFWIN